MGNILTPEWKKIESAVHPHARGEHNRFKHCKIPPCGSSPRTWGTSNTALAKKALNRFIPTHVGNIKQNGYTEETIAVHPHARGEHDIRERPDVDLVGSSPRTWGTCSRSLSHRGIARFIPTHVGNIPTQKKSTKSMTVHPHARGEHVVHDFSILVICGSSPRTWGTYSNKAWGNFAMRFIPTHVGNIKCFQSVLCGKSVHPHARGEHVERHPHQERVIGSSPRTWGTSMQAQRGRAERRFIPTHVGNI